MILINVLLRPNVVVFDDIYSPERVRPELKKVEDSKQIQTPLNKQ